MNLKCCKIKDGSCFLYISPPSVNKGIFELFDLNGKVLGHEKFDDNRFEFYRKDLTTGVLSSKS